MTDSSLELDLIDLRAEIGDFAGFGLGDDRYQDDAWDDEQIRRIDKTLKAALRTVYYTEEMEGIPGGYQWSWLQPKSLLTVASGSTSVPLPEDCNGLLDDIIPIAGDGGAAQYKVRIVDYSLLYSARNNSPGQVGRPQLAYQAPRKGTIAGSRFDLEIFPTADQDYQFQIWYEVAPAALTPANPRLYGGPGMSETFKAAARAAYERDYDGAPGPETANFLTRLRAAIAQDRKRKPLYLGQNSDHSDDVGRNRLVNHGEFGSPFLVNGTAY